MRKTTIALFGMFLMGISSSQAQTNRVGINTDTPQASLDIKAVPVNKLPSGTVQGVLFPNFTTTDRDSFATDDIKPGTMIYNTDRQCLEIYTSYGGKLGWHCINLTGVAPSSIPDFTVNLPEYPILASGYQFEIPYTGRATGSYQGTRVSIIEPDLHSRKQVTLIIPAGTFSGNDGGTIPAYFEILDIDKNDGINSTHTMIFEADCSKEGNIKSLNIPVNTPGLPSFNITVSMPCNKPTFSNTTITLDTDLEGKYRFNIPYKGRASMSYEETRVPVTISGQEITLVIPAGKISSTTNEGSIPAYFEGNLYPNCNVGTYTGNYPVNIQGLSPFNVTLNVIAKPCSFVVPFSVSEFGILLKHGKQIQIPYKGRMFGSYKEIRQTLPTTNINTTDGNHENVTLVIPAGTFSNNLDDSIPAYFEVDGDGTLNSHCLSSTDIDRFNFTINGMSGEVYYSLERAGCL